MELASRATLDRVAGAGAPFVAEMDRHEGAFHFQVRRHAESALPLPARDELLPVVPAGSRWSHAAGWSSYFGWPLEAARRHFWAVGAEEVQAGPDRTAFPLVRVYLHVTPPAAILAALAATLDAAGAQRGRPAAGEPGIVVVPMTGATPGACAVEQAALLRQAAAACAGGGTPLYRTALLVEGEVLPLLGFPHRPPRGVDRCLLGAPEALCRTFSASARAALYLRAFWSPR
jgi:hypothetical protein